ncbi:uncharacterized protein LOC144910871 isoform X2 [Branchiostoma floridae x Branchiostoma belcheri]
MPQTGAPSLTMRDRKQHGQQHQSQPSSPTRSSTGNTNRQSGSRSHHHSERLTRFSYEEPDAQVQQGKRSGNFKISPAQMKSDARGIHVPERPAQSNSRERRGYWRSSPVQTRNIRRNASRHPPSAAQGRSDSRDRTEEATGSKTGQHRDSVRREAGCSTSKSSRSQEYVTHLDEMESRAPHRRSPVQTRSSTRVAGSLTEQSRQPQPGPTAAQGKKNSKAQVVVRGKTSANQAGTSQGKTVRGKSGAAHSTSRLPQESSGRHYGKQEKKRTAVPKGGIAQPAGRKTARKTDEGSTSRGGTARFGGRKSNTGTAPPSVATTRTTGKKRTADQAFVEGKQTTAKACVTKKGNKKRTTPNEAKSQSIPPATTAETTKRQRIAAEPDCCAICLSELTTQPLARPDICRHVYCLDCLQAWQQRRKTCPIDNKQFQTLLPYSKDGKDIKIPVVKSNTSNRNGVPVVPVGNQPYNPVLAGQNRSEPRNQRDPHNVHWVDDSEEWDDHQESWDDEGSRAAEAYWGAASAHYSDGQRHLGDTQGNLARLDEHSDNQHTEHWSDDNYDGIGRIGYISFE